MITSEEFTRPLSSPSPSRPTRRSRHRPSVLSDVHPLLLPEVFKRLQFVTPGAQALEVIVLIAAAIGKSDDVIDLSSNSSAAPHADRRGRQQTMPKPLQRSPSDALDLVHTFLATQKSPNQISLSGFLGDSMYSRCRVHYPVHGSDRAIFPVCPTPSAILLLALRRLPCCGHIRRRCSGRTSPRSRYCNSRALLSTQDTLTHESPLQRAVRLFQH